MEWMKINVFRKHFKNEIMPVKVDFEMITDELPNTGEHYLIPFDKVHLFVMDYFKSQIDKVISADKVLYRLTQVEQHIKILHENKKDKPDESEKECEQPSSET